MTTMMLIALLSDREMKTYLFIGKKARKKMKVILGIGWDKVKVVIPTRSKAQKAVESHWKKVGRGQRIAFRPT